MKKDIIITLSLVIGTLYGVGIIWIPRDYPIFKEEVEKIAASKPMPQKPEPAPIDNLEIINGRYGAQDKWVDVTKIVKEKIEDNTLSVHAGNNLAGDPIEGEPKELIILYKADGIVKLTSAKEGKTLSIPPVPDLSDPLYVIENKSDLLEITKKCPSEIGYYGVNLVTGKTIEYNSDQPACMASIVKLFVLLELVRQEQDGGLDFSTKISIKGSEDKECTIDEAIDLMIGLSDNDATYALASLAGYDKINTLASQLEMDGVSDTIIPENEVLLKQLDRRVFKLHTFPKDMLLEQCATAKGMVKYFELLHENNLINEQISARVRELLKRNPKRFVSDATPFDYSSVGKGGSLIWKRPLRPQYNMTGFNLYIYNKSNAIAFCIWVEWFPEKMSEELRNEWLFGIANCLANLLIESQASN